MGRNGKKIPVFSEMIKFVNEHVNENVSSEQILLGKEPGRNSETAYLYKFIKLGYVKQVNSFVQDKHAMYHIVKGFPINYNSVMLKKEMRVLNGFID